MNDDERTPQQIVAEANELARQFYLQMGYEVEDGYRFDKSRHPQERLCWYLSGIAYEHLQSTDLSEVLAEAEDE